MRTPFLFKLLIVAAAAIGVVYLVKPSLLPIGAMTNSRPVLDIVKERIAAASGAGVSAPGRSRDDVQGAMLPTQAASAAPATPASSNPIVKCMVDGKVLYTNEKCPEKASGQAMNLQQWKGVPAPNSDLLGEISTQRDAAHRARLGKGGDAGVSRTRCNALVLEADELLAALEQASSPQERDRLAARKADLQARADRQDCN